MLKSNWRYRRGFGQSMEGMRVSDRMVNLTIDGVEVSVPQGATVFQAARAAGIDIPHLCYDPDLGLPPTASCRLCVVEVEGTAAPVASCAAPATAGMTVKTDTENLHDIRRTIIELLLSDHSDDCAGNCLLEEYAYSLGIRQRPPQPEPVFTEPEEDSPALVYDRDMCILCGRCVAVCELVQVTSAIDFLGRGYDTKISLPPGLDREDSVCEFCGGCAAVCPTGAIRANRMYGGRGATTVRTTCPYCGVGCQFDLNVLEGRIVGVTSSPDMALNAGWLCVKGRFGYEFIHHADRLTTPLIRRNGDLQPATWDEALDYAASRLTEIKDKHGADSIGVMASAKCTNEENYLLQKFARAAIGTNNVDHCARLCHASTVAGLAQAFGSGAMTNSIDDLADSSDLIFVIGSNTTECHPIIGAAIKRAVTQRGARLIVADPRNIELARFATVHLRHKHGTDVALVNGMSRAIIEAGLQDNDFIARRTEGFEEYQASLHPYTPKFAEKITGVPADDIELAARLYSEAGAAAIVYSMGITQHTTGTDNVLALANLAMLTGNIGKPGAGVNPLRGQNNVQGACDMGALPNFLPGYQKVDDDNARTKFENAWGVSLPTKPGLTVTEMIEEASAGRLKAAYIMGENPVLSDPDSDHVEASLKNLEFLVVQDIFLSETANLANIVLPAASFAEKDGTFANTERRVQRVRKAVDPPGEARTDQDIICDLAGRVGLKMSYSDAASVQGEIASLAPIFGGITYNRLDGKGLQWPCPTLDHPGTPILHTEKFTCGLGKFHPVEFIPAKELPDEDYPFLLSTGRILQHFHTGTMSRRAAVLKCLVPVGVIEVNPEDASRLGLEDGKPARVASRRGEITIDARVTDRVTPGTLFLAFHYKEAPANRLTLAALDPVAKIPEFKVCAARLEPVSIAG